VIAMVNRLDKLSEVLESIVNRLDNKENRSAEENLLLVDAKLRLDILKLFNEKKTQDD